MMRSAGSRFALYEFHPGIASDWLILCDHASCAIPPGYADLGLPRAERERHIGWDLGAADVARRLARSLAAPLALHGVSRLFADANRPFDDPTFAPEASDGTLIPGNAQLDAAERELRWARYHQPYHARIRRHLDVLQARGVQPFIVSVHSFTPRMGNSPRPWPVGVLWREDERVAAPLIRHLRRDGTDVGNNRPYDGHEFLGYTVVEHAIQRGLPFITIELRQDLLAQPAGRAFWARKLYAALTATRRELRAG